MKLESSEPSVAPWRALPIHEFVDLILNDEATVYDPPCILAVDGRSGSGKTTIAALLHQRVPNSIVVHTDDVAWHHSFFDWSNLLIDGVLKPLKNGRAVHYQPPGWQTHGRLGAIEIPTGLKLVIVEGVGASRREVMPWIDRSLWIQSDFDEAQRRGIARDGGTKEAENFWHEWMAQEVDFLQRQRPWERATAIINGTPTQPYDRNSEIVVSVSNLA